MRFTLKEYQEDAVRSVLRSLKDAKDDYRGKDRRVAFSLSAITGAGKTVMASAVFEALFDGSEDFDFEADPSAVVLWVTDDPNLNQQTRYRIMEASDRLDVSRLRIIEDRFDFEQLEAGKVYFLNRQKLTAKTFISHSDQRTFTLWDTIGNTINDEARTLYLVLDEAHRGMRYQSKAKSDADDRDRLSTVLRLINGYNGSPPVPIVLGISATVDRFNEAMKDAIGRTTLPSVTVDNSAVQASGLLKDTITLDLPDESGSFATVLAREAALACREASSLWTDYATAEKMAEPVYPLLVVQVPNKPSRTEIATLLDTIFEAWPELTEDSLANVFGEHSDETYGKHAVPYIAPQDVQEASHVRVVLAKDAISTGWDCPRAETLLSLRPAKDRTHITQLLGRLVRTPLARRIDSDERLNAVTCFLPRFDLPTATEVAEIMTGLKEDANGAPPPGRRVLVEPLTMLWSSTIPDGVRDCFAKLPSKVAPRSPARPLKRLLNMAAELALDELLPDPNAQAHQKIYAVLDGQAAQHKQALDTMVDSILTADIRRITANRLSQEATEKQIQLEADERTVGDAFRTATRAFGSSIANGYAKKIALEASAGSADEDFDIHAAMARVAALSMQPAIVEQVESAAEKIVTEWFSSQHATIKSLSEERRSTYDEIKQQAGTPQKIDLVVPTSRMEMTFELEGEGKTPLPTRDRHLLCDEKGDYPIGRLSGSWERAVLDTELSRDNLVAWYRNPSAPSKDAIQVPWLDGETWRTMQPDFVFFSTSADGSLSASIVDPHGHHLSDALGKLHGLADFAEEFADDFMRVEAISKNERGDLGSDKGSLRMLDLTDSATRDKVRNCKSAADAYRAAGQKYE